MGVTHSLSICTAHANGILALRSVPARSSTFCTTFSPLMVIFRSSSMYTPKYLMASPRATHLTWPPCSRSGAFSTSLVMYSHFRKLMAMSASATTLWKAAAMDSRSAFVGATSTRSSANARAPTSSPPDVTYPLPRRRTSSSPSSIHMMNNMHDKGSPWLMPRLMAKGSVRPNPVMMRPCLPR